MAKKDQQSSWNSKRFKTPVKNTVEPVAEIPVAENTTKKEKP